LQLQFLDGGTVPLDSTGKSFLYMDGVILDAGVGAFSKVTDQNVIILPFKPGDAGYSPIVRLFDFPLPPGHTLGDGTYTGICRTPPCTDPAQVDITTITAAPFNTIFV